MNPDAMYAVATAHQHELRRQAEVARKAAEFKTSQHRRRVPMSLPRVPLGAAVTAVRKLARAWASPIPGR
jgi:hypothetical protein